MEQDKEQKIFHAVLWIFLIGSLAFFTFRLSSGRVYLLTPIWFMFLLLDAGFILFIFVPHAGSGVPGVPGRHAETIREHSWYPRNLAEMVDGRPGGAGGRLEGVRPPSRAISPVPLVPLVLLLAVIALCYPRIPDEKAWQTRETERLRGVYAEARGELLDIETLATGLARRAEETVDWSRIASPAPADRAAAIQKVDSLARASGFEGTPLPAVGIQIFSPVGERLAWGGTPRQLAVARRPGAPDLRVFTSRTPLYTLLVCESNAKGGAGIVVVDIPLEVNYRINNRFLRSTSLAEILTRRYGDEVDFAFSMGEHRGFLAWSDRSLSREEVDVASSPVAGVQVTGIVQASTGLPLARLRVLGDPLPTVASEDAERRAEWAGLIVSIAVIVVAVWVFRRFCKWPSPEGAMLRGLVRRILVLAALVAAIRLVLLELDIPGRLVGTAVFDPALFADALPGGFLRNAGEFLVSAVFGLVLVFGSIKAFRTYYPGYIERPLARSGGLHPGRAVVKGAVAFAAIAGALWLSSNIVSRAVLNSQERLTGPDVDLLDVSTITIHLSLLFIISAILIAALFITRLAHAAGGGRRSEAFAAAALMLAGIALLYAGRWPLLCVAAGLVVLAFRIFPLLKKEETVSIVLASFLLVLMCSLLTYAVANETYTGLRKDYVREKVREYNRPEDNWMQFLLPDICADIATDAAMPSRLASRRESSAFEIWAESRLSRLNFSCVIEVYGANGTRFARFAVGMPFDLPRERPDAARLMGGPSVVSARVGTRDGAVSYYEGYAPIHSAMGALLGWVEITVPHFFENPELLARTGRMAPAILQNIDPGGKRRSDEPETQLVARIAGDRVIASSSPALRAGSVLPAPVGDWIRIRAGRDRYNCATRLGAGGEGYLVGYRETSVSAHVLSWATIVSLGVFMTLLSFVVLLALRRLPVLKGVVPNVSPGKSVGFRQKVLLSFLLVSILPVLILGAFSSQVIARRFRAEEENKALLGAQAAVSLIDHSIRTEAAALAGGNYIGELLATEGATSATDAAGIDTRSFTLIGSDGEALYGGAAAGLTREQLAELLASGNAERVIVSFDGSVLYGGVVVPIVSGGTRGGSLYYRRALDDEFVKSVAEALGAGTDINLYYGALVRASSERELFVGGFLDPILAPALFVDLALHRASPEAARASLGDYSYYVASAALPALGGAENAVLSVPMLYEPVLMREEVRRTSTLIVGLLALLFAAAVTLGVFLAGKIFNPIAALQGGTRKIIEGELEFKLEAGAPDEIGELVASFNTMTAALRDARRDILERQRHLAAVLDNVATGVMASGRDGTIITLNPSGERILGLSSAEAIGRSPGEIFRGELGSIGELFASSGEEVREVELSLFSGDRARTVKAVVAGLVEGGERLGTVVVFDDLTELIRSKKLSAWVEMARQIAHEVKNPLTPIKLSAQLMRRAYESKSADFGEIFTSGVETVIQQTDILRRIATEFSSFGKVTQLVPEPVRLGEFLAEIVSYYRGAERVRISLACEDGVTVRADREALRKILVNLMENAIEAMHGAGEISVAMRRDGDRATVTVLDSGKGLSPEMQARLFEPYFSTKTNGIGLGLAISQGLARAMDGEIRLRNRGDAPGVEAVVTLPLARET